MGDCWTGVHVRICGPDCVKIYIYMGNMMEAFLAGVTISYL